MIDKIHMNYHGVINSGHTLTMAGKLDPWRMYYNKAIYTVPVIVTFPDFSFNKKGIYNECFLLEIDGNIDYNVLTSLN